MVSAPARAASDLSVFSFRAECPADVMGFLGQAYADPEHPRMLDMFGIRMERPTSDADVLVEFKTHPSISLDTMRRWMREVPDAHVMIQTLRPVPLAENSLEREPEFARQVG